ncbi:MAG: ATP-binding protein, partial [Firmicutes bacterium]|nr:ATP-binding protein [Bacillota bacterium]
RFMLVAALNPTPKGDMPDSEFSQRQMERYLSRISGPLVDRVDIHVEVPRVPYRQLTGKANGTDSATLREKVAVARAIQCERNGSPLKPNSSLSGRQLDRIAILDEPSQALLKAAMSELNLSARAYDKIRRVSRTIADLEEAEQIEQHHASEAIGYRLLDRMM